MFTDQTNRYDTVVIGGGQAGLAAAYFLSHVGQKFVVLDAHDRAGETWRRRWDSLRLFSPTEHNGLPGHPFPAANGTFPTKDEMAAYLERYVDHFWLPVSCGVQAVRVSRHSNDLIVECRDRCYRADNVIVAARLRLARPAGPSTDPEGLADRAARDYERSKGCTSWDCPSRSA